MKNEIRKVILPINIKLSLMVLLITGVSLFTYVYLAVDMFKTDKVAYVFESVEDQNNQIAQGIQRELIHLEQIHQIFPQASQVNSLTKKILETNPQILGYFELLKNKINRKFVKEQLQNFNLEAVNSQGSQTEFFISHQNDTSYLIHQRVTGDITSYLVCDLTSLKSNIPDSLLYKYFFKVADHYIGEKLSLSSEVNIKEYFHQTIVLELDEKTIVSIKPLLNGQVIFMTSIAYDKALKAATQLQERSIYFAGLIAAFIIIAILILSGFITRPIKKLYAASIELSQANFSYRVKLKEKDEIGVLGDSFNNMAAKIQKYMEEMKEKVRLENELQTAKLVQKSFFPNNSIRSEKLKLDAFYQPASECGGDWWGHLKFEKTELIILIDVTGHGTAAALLTAIIHNSLTSLKFLCEKDPRYSQDPALVMNFLNHSFCAVNINLNATAFVLMIKEGSMCYCNASHNPPYYISYNDNGVYSKQDFVPLMGESGSRLGENLKSEYTIHEQTFNSNDHLVLYTDGILEAQDSDEKAYGTRNFIKSLSANLSLSNDECLQMTLRDFQSFMGKSQPGDDITLIKMEL